MTLKDEPRGDLSVGYMIIQRRFFYWILLFFIWPANVWIEYPCYNDIVSHFTRETRCRELKLKAGSKWWMIVLFERIICSADSPVTYVSYYDQYMQINREVFLMIVI